MREAQDLKQILQIKLLFCGMLLSLVAASWRRRHFSSRSFIAGFFKTMTPIKYSPAPERSVTGYVFLGGRIDAITLQCLQTGLQQIFVSFPTFNCPPVERLPELSSHQRRGVRIASMEVIWHLERISPISNTVLILPHRKSRLSSHV